MRVFADFESANIVRPRVEGSTIRFRAKSHGSPNPLWFYFRVDDLPDQRVTLVLENAAQCLGGLQSFAVVRPVVSLDNRNWQRVTCGAIDKSKGTFIFQHQFSNPSAFIAFSYPYGLNTLENYLAQLRKRKNTGVKVLARSPGGRPVYHITIGRSISASYNVWICARNHAGETPPSYVLEGLLNWSTSSREDYASWMRKNLWLNVIPMVDVDGVVEGAYGKRRPPADYGESWSDDSPYDSVRAILQAIEESSTKVPYSLFIDIHSPTPKDGHYCYAVEPEYSSKHYRRDLSRFCQILSHHAPQDSPFPPNSVRYLREGCQYTFHNQYLTYGVQRSGVISIWWLTTAGYIISKLIPVLP